MKEKHILSSNFLLWADLWAIIWGTHKHILTSFRMLRMSQWIVVLRRWKKNPKYGNKTIWIPQQYRISTVPYFRKLINVLTWFTKMMNKKFNKSLRPNWIFTMFRSKNFCWPKSIVSWSIIVYYPQKLQLHEKTQVLFLFQ